MLKEGSKRELVLNEIQILYDTNKTVISKRAFSQYLSQKYPLQFPIWERAWTTIGYVTGTNGKKSKKLIELPIKK